MRILISAAEASSDAHGAELLKALQGELRATTEVEAFGIGGPQLQARGLRAIVDARDLMVMGSTEVFGHLPKIIRSLNRITKAAAEEKPDVAVVLDFPDFHFRLSKRLKKLGIPIVYYIPPKVWVWRKRRVHFLKKYFEKVLCIFPFEEAFYRKHQVPVSYVGNPLVDELPLHLTQQEVRKQLELNENDPVLVLMPGSRKAELNAHLEVMLQAASLAAEKLKRTSFLKVNQPIQVLMPFPVTSQLDGVAARIQPLLKRYESLLKVRLSQGDAHQCLIAADAGIVKSGTSTLEAGLLGCPQSIIYKPSKVTGWIFKYIIRYRGPVGLVNLVAGWEPGKPFLVSEILMDQVTVEALASEIFILFTDLSKRKRIREGYMNLRNKVSVNSAGISPSLFAAREIIDVVKKASMEKC
jgi:lipid-A-disaccharide synthase